jgi:hypothetical protein
MEATQNARLWIDIRRSGSPKEKVWQRVLEADGEVVVNGCRMFSSLTPTCAHESPTEMAAYADMPWRQPWRRQAPSGTLLDLPGPAGSQFGPKFPGGQYSHGE